MLAWPAIGIAFDSSSLVIVPLASASCLPRSRAVSFGLAGEPSAGLGAVAGTGTCIVDGVTGRGAGVELSRGRSHPARTQTALSAIVAPSPSRPEPDTLWPSAEQPRDKRYDKQHQEDEKQDFRDLRGTCSNATESEHGGDQRDDKKYQRIVEHL